MKLLQARNDRCSPHNRLMRYTWSRDRATRRSLHPGLKLLQLQCIHHAQLITTSSTNQSKKKEERELKRIIIELHSLSWICMGLSTKVVINAIAVQSASRATTTLLCASRRQCLVLRPTIANSMASLFWVYDYTFNPLFCLPGHPLPYIYIFYNWS
jgi:hypothetical protein